MKKKALLALILCAVLVLSGCQIRKKDQAVDDAQVIVQLKDGTTLDKKTVSTEISKTANALYYFYYMNYGYSMNVTDDIVQDDVLAALARKAVVAQKINEQNITLTEEEETAASDSGKSAYQMCQIYSQVYGNLPIYAMDYLMEEKTLSTEEEFTEDAVYEAKVAKLKADVVKDVAVTAGDEDTLKANYDEALASAKESYATAAAYASAYNQQTLGNTVYYIPEGVRYVKQILLKFADEDSTAISDARTALNAAEDDETKASAQAALDAAIAAAYANMQGTVDEVTAKIAAGEDFEALMETYNQDPGMTSEPFKTTGYAVGADYTDFDTVFVDTAMALNTVGDVSEPAASDLYGYYIIKYVSDAQSGDTPYEQVKDALTASLLTEKQNALYKETVDQWVADAEVKNFADRLAN